LSSRVLWVSIAGTALTAGLLWLYTARGGVLHLTIFEPLVAGFVCWLLASASSVRDRETFFLYGLIAGAIVTVIFLAAGYATHSLKPFAAESELSGAVPTWVLGALLWLVIPLIVLLGIRTRSALFSAAAVIFSLASGFLSHLLAIGWVSDKVSGAASWLALVFALSFLTGHLILKRQREQEPTR